MITSDARVRRVAAETSLPAAVSLPTAASLPADAIAAHGVAGGGVWIRVRPSAHTKCVRCWQQRADVGVSSEHPQLCGRCGVNLHLPGENRSYC